MAAMIVDERGARDLNDKRRSAPRDRSADCLACGGSGEVEHGILLGEDERAIRTARSILDGAMHCGVIPRTALTLVLLPPVRLGRADLPGPAVPTSPARRWRVTSVRNRFDGRKIRRRRLFPMRPLTDPDARR